MVPNERKLVTQMLENPTRRSHHKIVLLVTFLLLASVVVLTAAPAAATNPGANGKIAYERSDAIWTMNADGSNQTRLTGAMVLGSFHEPAWSPDGTKIAYRFDPSFPVGATDDIHVMKADGTGGTNLTATSGIDEREPTWSPDGKKIAYVRAGAIWTMNADGSNQKAWTEPPLFIFYSEPEWSPDGSRIVFRASNKLTKGTSEIYVISLRATNPVNLTGTAGIDEFDPTWSPDGKKIAYSRGGAIWTMASDGARQAALTKPPLFGSHHEPSWSPDGTKILFRYNETVGPGVNDIWVTSMRSTNPIRLTSTAGIDEFNPAWQPLNRPPVAVGDTYFGARDWGIPVASPGVLGNDSDPDGDSLVVYSPGSVTASHGTLTLNADGSFIYKPVAGFVGTDSFKYRAYDGIAASNKVTVYLKTEPISVVGLVNPDNGEWHLGFGLAPQTSFYFGNPGDYPFVGDWNCDGADTPGLYRQSDGYVYLRNTNTQGVADVSFFFGNPGDVPIAGDFNNDGCDTVSIYRPSNQRFYIINALGTNDGGLGAADYDFLFGNPGDKPVVGDWDGDGVDEIGLHRESTGFFYYRNTLTTGVADGELFFGDPGDRFVAGDWGVIDGRDTPAVFRPSNQTYYFRHTMTQGNADYEYLWAGAGTTWLPVAGDFGFAYTP